MRHFKTHLLVTLLLLLAAGQVAMATSKTVKYRITSVTQNGTSYTLTFGLADGSDVPFKGFTTSSVTVNTSTNTDQTVTLGDGFSLRLQWTADANTNVIIYDSGYGCNINTNKGYVTYTVGCASDCYFTTHLDMQNNEGSQGMMTTDHHAINPDFNYEYQLSQSYNSMQGFGRLVVTYTDAPPLSLLTSPSANKYNITSKRDLAVLAGYVNNGGNNCSGLTFLQTQNITYTHFTAWNLASSTENNYTAIGTSSHRFQGTFDGQGYTISGIRIYCDTNANGDYQGLFGYVGEGATIKRVNLADARITGRESVGGIAGHIYLSTVEDCTVAANVCIHDINVGKYHGGIVGYSQGTVQRCLSHVTLTADNATYSQYYSAIVGRNNDHAITDCIAIGASLPSVSDVGAIIGYDIINSKEHVVQRNYYRACTVAGTADATGVGVGNDKNTQSPHDVTTNQGAQALYTVTLPEHASVVRTASATLPGSGNKTYTSGADINGTPYAYGGAQLSLSYDATAIPDGYDVLYTVTKTSDNSDITASVLSGTTLTMPSYNINVSAHFMSHPVTVSYVDADGNGQEITAQPLTGSETELGMDGQATWYIANSNISYDHQLTLNGDVHLILADGKTMAMTQTGSQYCIQGSGKNLTLYGQDSGTGALTMNSSGYGVLARTFVINGGHITANTTNHTFIVEYDLTINDGVVKATSSDSSSGFFSSNEGSDKICLVTINGGQVETNRISCSEPEHDDTPCRILLDYRNPDDYIKVGEYQITIVWIADGKVMKDGNQYFAGQHVLSNEAARTGLSNKKFQPVIPVSADYLDADGITRTAMAIPLPESQPQWSFSFMFWKPSLWFVVNSSNISYGPVLRFYSDTHLILADNCKLTTTGGINSTYDLSIYGQSNGIGALEFESGGNSSVLYAEGVLTINGGHITASGNLGSNQSDLIIINGGVVSVTQSISAAYSVTVNGGQVSANTISSSHTILGYRDKDHDSIYSRSYSDGSIAIADGQVMTDGTNTYSGTVSKSDVGNKTLRPAGVTSSYDLKLAQGTKDGVTAWWGTYYHGTVDVTLPEGATAYTMGADYKLYRLGTDGRIIPKGKAVVIIATVATPVDHATSPATATIPLTPVGTGIPSITDHAPGGNILQGSNATVFDAPDYPYVLGIVNNDPATIDFHKYYGSTIPAHKAFYIITQ